MKHVLLRSKSFTVINLFYCIYDIFINIKISCKNIQKIARETIIHIYSSGSLSTQYVN